MKCTSCENFCARDTDDAIFPSKIGHVKHPSCNITFSKLLEEQTEKYHQLTGFSCNRPDNVTRVPFTFGSENSTADFPAGYTFNFAKLDEENCFAGNPKQLLTRLVAGSKCPSGIQKKDTNKSNRHRML
jgi:hypothetical protein